MEGTLFYNRTGFALKGLLQLPDFLLEIDSRLYNKLKVVYGRKEIDLAENVAQRLSDVFIIGNTLLIQTSNNKVWVARILANSFYSAYLNSLKSFIDACSITADFIFDLKLKFRHQDFGEENIWQQLEKKNAESFKALLPFKPKCFEIKKERDIVIHRNHRVFHMTGEGDPNIIGENSFKLRMTRNPNVDIIQELKNGNQAVLTTFDEKFEEDKTFLLSFSKAILSELVQKVESE
jgi:hypothetical protein